jgi:hypothetical protein
LRPQPADDLVNRGFDPVAPDRFWVMDVTEHPTPEGKLYLAVVLDAWSRWWGDRRSHPLRALVDALQMAIWRRRPPVNQTVARSDHESQHASWAFGRRLRGARLLGSMGSVGGLLRQLRRRILPRDTAARAPRRAPLGNSSAHGVGHLRLDRELVQPHAPAQLLPDAQSRRLRSQSRRRGRLNRFGLETVPSNALRNPQLLRAL